MSHSYNLRPNAGGRMQRRLDSHVAAFGEQNRDKIVAVPSNTGLGVHLYFDPERSLSPDPEQAANRQCTDSTEGVAVVDDPGSESSLSDLESDVETVAPDTPPRGQVEDHHSILEEDHQRIIRQAGNKEEWIAIMRRDYEGSIERFRREHANMFSFPAEGVSDHLETLSPEPFESGDLPPVVSHPTLPQSAGPSHGQGAPKDRKQYQQYTPLRRNAFPPFTVSESSRDEATESVGADGKFVVVARRVPKLGPCGTVVLDHDTGDDELVTKCYRVREEELSSIDGDGDSVMGSDD